MRIGIDALPIDNQSGSGIYTCELLSALAKVDRRNEYHVFIPSGFAAIPDSLHGENFHLHPVRLPHPALRPLWVQTMLPPRARALRLDILHSTQFSAPILGSPPLVVTIHDVIYRMFPETIRASRLRYYQCIVPRVARKAKMIITDSQSAKTDIVRELGVDESIVKAIPLAVSEGFEKPVPTDEIESLRNAYSLPARYVLSVGTLEPRKNLPVLIEAFLRIASTFPDVHLAIVGRAGWDFECLFSADDADDEILSERVHFLGFVPREHLPAIYQGASVFAFPSLYEGFGLPLLEAMTSGVPVVASGIPTSLELLKQEGTGLVVEADDVDGWAKAIEDILADRELSNWLARNGKQVARRYCWERTAESTLAAYEMALKNQRES